MARFHTTAEAFISAPDGTTADEHGNLTLPTGPTVKIWVCLELMSADTVTHTDLDIEDAAGLGIFMELEGRETRSA